jgi:hypothetical protein
MLQPFITQVQQLAVSKHTDLDNIPKSGALDIIDMQPILVSVAVGIPAQLLRGKGADANNLPEATVENHPAVLIPRWLFLPVLLVPSGQAVKSGPLCGACLYWLANKIFCQIHQQVPGRGAL